jgi:S1-C subfamily serine protease
MLWVGLAIALTAGAAALFLAIRREAAPDPAANSQPEPPATLGPFRAGAAPTPTATPASVPPTIPASVPTAPMAALDEGLRNRLKNATVLIKVMQGRRMVSMGSGFFIADDGLIATNHHVIASRPLGSRLVIQLFGEKADQDAIDCVADDPLRDLALLRLKRVKPPAVLTLYAGPSVPETTPVVVVGHPQGEFWSITQGTITGERTLDEQRFYGTDARIEPGNSGGPVTFRSSGDVIGISDWKIRATSLNYAIPVQALIDLVQTTGARAGRPCNR